MQIVLFERTSTKHKNVLPSSLKTRVSSLIVYTSLNQVKRRLGHKDPLSLETFEAMVEEGPNSDIESISGSESEDEAETSGAKVGVRMGVTYD